VPFQGTWMGVTLPGAALRLPRAMVHPALWADERSETSRPTLPYIATKGQAFRRLVFGRLTSRSRKHEV